MNNQIEDFFKQNRQQFDAEEPGPHVWKKIQESLVKKNNSLVFWKIAAVFFLMTTTYLWLNQSVRIDESTIAQEERAAFLKIEDYYSIQLKMREGWMEENSMASGMDLRNEYDRLLAMYEVLRIEWEHHPTSALKDAMTLNLIVRLDLLTRQMDSGQRQMSWN